MATRNNRQDKHIGAVGVLRSMLMIPQFPLNFGMAVGAGVVVGAAELFMVEIPTGFRLGALIALVGVVLTLLSIGFDMWTGTRSRSNLKLGDLILPSSRSSFETAFWTTVLSVFIWYLLSPEFTPYHYYLSGGLLFALWTFGNFMHSMERRWERGEILIHTYPEFVFAWPLVIAGPLFLALERWGMSSEYMAWSYIILFLVILLALGFEIGRNGLFLIAVASTGTWFAGMWLRDVKGFTVFGDIYRYLADLNLQLDPNFCSGIGALVFIVLFIMSIGVRLDRRWRITHNEIERYSWGRIDASLARGAKAVKTSYPNIIKFFLGFGAGSILVYDTRGQKLLAELKNVPFLPFKKRALNGLMETTSVVVQQNDEHAEADYGDEEESEVLS